MWYYVKGIVQRPLFRTKIVPGYDLSQGIICRSLEVDTDFLAWMYSCLKNTTTVYLQNHGIFTWGFSALCILTYIEDLAWMWSYLENTTNSSVFSADDKLDISPAQKIGFDTPRKFAWNVKSYFLEKIRKIFQNVACLNFYPACKLVTFTTLLEDNVHMSKPIFWGKKWKKIFLISGTK